MTNVSEYKFFLKNEYTTFITVMRAVLAYLLMSLLLFGLGAKTFVVIQWKINQAEITEKYCVNKDKPKMNCNGKCYLSKQLEKLEIKEKEERKKYPSPAPLMENTNFAWIVKHNFPKLMMYSIQEKGTLGFNKPLFWYNLSHHDIDHPPQV